ncbi:hypothetical protein [Haloferula sp. BvORR071]|uniref:hypothetical protein n=1 Tax=Haloferula sp. BvORR071 TaxID=1396141 RepID=UPI00224104BE|nr:hypothetical protein [Haloferula sp. BvORR071]
MRPVASGLQKLRIPLHRSLLFWAGMIVAVSSAWAWWHSTRYLTALRCGNLVVMNAASRVSFGSNHYGRRGWDATHGSLAGHELKERLRFGAPKWIRQEVYPMRPGEKCGSGYFSGEIDRTYLDGPTNGGWQLFVPHWIPFAASALPCMCVALYRAEKRGKRKRRDGVADFASEGSTTGK